MMEFSLMIIYFHHFMIQSRIKDFHETGEVYTLDGTLIFARP
jgi:hypothetical protein